MKTSTVGTQEDTENGADHANQMQTEKWKSKQCTTKSKIANEGRTLQARNKGSTKGQSLP